MAQNESCNLERLLDEEKHYPKNSATFVATKETKNHHFMRDSKKRTQS